MQLQSAVAGGVKLIGRWVFLWRGRKPGEGSPRGFDSGAFAGACMDGNWIVTHHLAIHGCVRLAAAAAGVPDFWLWLRLCLWWLSQCGLVPLWPDLASSVDLSDCHECRPIAELPLAVAAVDQSVLGEACCGFMSAKGSESNVMGRAG